MRSITEADAIASAKQVTLVELRREMIDAAENGKLEEVEAINRRLVNAAADLAIARAMPKLAECRHCSEEFEPVEYVELVISAIVIHHPAPPDGEGAETMIFPRGDERHLVYCVECAEESGLHSYLHKR